MKFRHPTGARLALTNGQVALVGSEWRELPQDFYQEALVQGCEVDKNVIEQRHQQTPEGDGNTRPFDESVAIREALELILTRNEAGDYTGSGMPNLNVVSGLVKFAVKKEHVYEIWHDLTKPKNSEETNAAE